jgi:DNA polymerase-4
MDWQRVIAHLDMDAFFASVEIADDPSLAGKPVIIGANPRGVVSAASYEARKYGVHSAMPVMRARKLCPQGVFLPGRHRRYGEVSRVIFGLLRDLVPVVEQTSVDEAYMDLTGTLRLLGPPEAAAAMLKARIRGATGLTASVGLAPVRFVAKIASDFDKPDGLTVVRPGEVAAFLAPLPLGKIPGVGPKTRDHLAKLGVRTIAETLARGREFLVAELGDTGGEWLWERVNGLDDSPVQPGGEQKSMGAENTFARDTRDPKELARWLALQAERVGRELRGEGYFGRTVTLKYKYSDFTQHTRSRTLEESTHSTEDILAAALVLLSGVSLERELRLIGLSVSNLDRLGPRPRLLPDPASERRDKLDQALDAISGKFGKKAVRRGRTFGFKD